MIPRMRPLIEATKDRELRKNVEGTIWMTIRNGSATPRIDRQNPRMMSCQGRMLLRMLPGGGSIGKAACFYALWG